MKRKLQGVSAVPPLSLRSIGCEELELPPKPEVPEPALLEPTPAHLILIFSSFPPAYLFLAFPTTSLLPCLPFRLIEDTLTERQSR